MYHTRKIAEKPGQVQLFRAKQMPNDAHMHMLVSSYSTTWYEYSYE